LQGVFRSHPVRTAVLPNFDPETYIDSVLRPLGRGGVGSLPHEAVRYALDQCPPDAADQDIMMRVQLVVELWRRQEGGGTAGLAEACRRCLTEDDRLRVQAGYRDPRWWRGRIRDWQRLGQADRAGVEHASASANHAGQPSAIAQSSQQSAAESPDSAAPDIAPELSPPADLTAEPGDDRVVLRWQTPSTVSADISFTVERSSGTGKHRVIGTTPNTTIEDPRPPGGRTVTYRVFAEHAPSGARSEAALASVVFTPPVTDLTADQELDGRVVGQWRTHPDVWRADVWRTPHGSPTDQANGKTVQALPEGFDDDPQPPPGRYVYSVVPVYRDPDTRQTYRGSRAEVEVEVFDQPPPPRVGIWESGDRESARVTLRWGALPDGVFLLMCRSAVEPDGAAGELLTVERAEQVGPMVWNGRGFTGTTATLPLPAGRWVLIPFAVAGRRAVRGNRLNVDVLPPVTSPEAIRNGPDVRVSWVWPDGLRLARVVWRGDGAELAREITLSEFQGRGGVTFRRGDAASIRITGVVRSGADELSSAAVTVSAPPQLPTLTYQVRHLPGLAGLLPWSRRRQVVLATDVPCAGVHARIYLHPPGPGREADVDLAVLHDLELGPDSSQDVMVKIPKSSVVPRPCYVSCHATAGSNELRVDDFGSRGREIR
jgi:hypothetical protein